MGFIENLFSTPIYVDMIKNLEEVQNEIDGVINNLQFVEPPSNWGKTHLLSKKLLTDKQDFFEINKMEITRSTILNHVTDYCNFLEFKIPKRYKIESWMTLFNMGDYAHTHNHGEADISGVYYYKTTGDDGDIFFESPVEGACSSLVYAKYAERWKHTPKIGKIILFPGWLKHGVLKNTKESKRHSISFNIFFDRINND
jgi:uncharacterized protein (TIGR02466 family)